MGILTLSGDYLTDSVENDAEWKLKIKIYNFDQMRFIMQKVKHFIPRQRDIKLGQFDLTAYSQKPDEEKRQENIQRANRRAVQKVTDAIRQIQADHMLTLQTRENIQDRNTFFGYFTRFIKLVRENDLINGELIKRKEKRKYSYVAVPELQKRGAYHMHCAVVDRQDINLLRACWYVALGGSVHDKGEQTLGQVDVQYKTGKYRGKKEKHTQQSLINYLVKYISKDFEAQEELGIHRYKRCRDIKDPLEIKQYIQACWSKGNQTFVDAIQEVIEIARNYGVVDFYQWNRGDDIYILHGKTEVPF